MRRYKKYSKQDQRSLATCAADCAERVLPYFERAYPKDDRPRKAIEACRTWVRTGVFKMADIRGASLAAPAKRKKIRRLVLLRVQQVRRWQLHTFSNTPTALCTMLLEPLPQQTLLVPRLRLPENAIGNHGVFQEI
jgi:hypothetical protein